MGFYLILSRRFEDYITLTFLLFLVVMDSNKLYGYVPTHSIAILFALSYVVSICTMIPALFIHYRNFALGIFIVSALGFQLTGHVSTAISAFIPENVPAWATQYIAFTIGKFATRITVGYVYYTCVARISNGFKCKKTIPGSRARNPLVFLIAAWLGLAGFVIRFVALGFEIAAVITQKDWNGNKLSFISSLLILLPTILLYLFLADVVYRTRKEVPWFRLTWMTGYYASLLIVPIFLLVQDVFGVVTACVPCHVEMVKVLCDLCMTKGILMMLGGQSYEIAYSWSQKRPKMLERIELQVKEIFERILSTPSVQQTERNEN
jgi:hypothetical protein